MNINRGNRVHFIGVGGVSMSRLARMASANGMSVTGSDRVYSETIKRLISSGVDAYVGSNIDKMKNANLVVYSSAIREDDIELSYAKRHNIECMERCEYLGYIQHNYDICIAVSGSHGKSTVTALLGHIMHDMDITCHVGAEAIEPLVETGTHYFITEACEYRRSFLHLNPTIGVVLGVDFDHPDEYRDMADIRGAFNEFMDKSEVVIAHEKVGREDAITYGIGDGATYRIENVRHDKGRYTFDVVHNGERVTLTSLLYGRYNVDNVVASYAIADTIGVENDRIIEGINTFSGLKRRNEYVGHTRNGAMIITDYAHHPYEIARVIECAHELTHGKVMVVFEPHTYSRTKSLIHEFVDSFYWADSLILLPTYPAREVEEDGYTTLDLVHYLNMAGDYPLYFDSYTKAIRYIEEVGEKGDIVLVLGAGSIDSLASRLNADKKDL